MLQLVLFPAFPGAGVPLRPWCVDEYGPAFADAKSDTTPEPDVPEPCWKCDGTGVFFGRGSVVNGQFVGDRDMCYPCRGKGYMTPADHKRTNYYYNHIYTLDR